MDDLIFKRRSSMANLSPIPSNELNSSETFSSNYLSVEAPRTRANNHLPFETYLLSQITSLESRLVMLTQSKNRTTQQAELFFEMFLDNINQAIIYLERA